MAGSKKYIKYFDNAGNPWALLRDESNVEGVIATDASIDITAADVGTHKWLVPRNLEPRVAFFKSTTTTKRREVVIPTIEAYDDLLNGDLLLTVRNFTDPDIGELFAFTGARPETIRPVVADIDTGETDGDAT